jgi:hypothetical protein
MTKAEALKKYWADVRAGLREPPKRNHNGSITRKTRATLDRTFGPDHDKAIIVTLHPDGRIELRPERTRRSETLSLIDVYRYAIRCRVGRGQLEKARERKARKAERLARQRQERAEKRLFAHPMD